MATTPSSSSGSYFAVSGALRDRVLSAWKYSEGMPGLSVSYAQ